MVGDAEFAPDQVVCKHGTPDFGAQLKLRLVRLKLATAHQHTGRTPDLQGAASLVGMVPFTEGTIGKTDGAPAGDYDVTVEWWVSPGRDLPAVNKLPAAYARAESSRMQVKVVPGTNELQPFELK